MGKGRGRSRAGNFGNYSNRARQPFFQSVSGASGGRISLLKVILLAVVLYFLLRLIVPLIWAFLLVALLVFGLKYLFERF